MYMYACIDISVVHVCDCDMTFDRYDQWSMIDFQQSYLNVNKQNKRIEISE